MTREDAIQFLHPNRRINGALFLSSVNMEIDCREEQLFLLKKIRLTKPSAWQRLPLPGKIGAVIAGLIFWPIAIALLPVFILGFIATVVWIIVRDHKKSKKQNGRRENYYPRRP